MIDVKMNVFGPGKMIGIVGGVGSYAGIDLIRKIYDCSGAITDQDHLPVSMLSIPYKIQDRTKFLLKETVDNPAHAIAEIISTLVLTGAEVIGIPCNTAHAPEIFEEIKKSAPSECKIVHMIDEVGRHVRTNYPAMKRMGVLCTNGTYVSNIYPDIMASYSLEVIMPSMEIQNALVHPAIYDPGYGIKAISNPVTEKARKDLRTAVAHLACRGAEAVVLACTEIPLAIREPEMEGCILIDSTCILALALVRESRAVGVNSRTVRL